MLRVMSIVGARPQFIKAAVVSRRLRRRDDVEEIFVHTGQHYDPEMSDVFFEELAIPRPDHHLGVGSGRHGEQTGRMLTAIEAVILAEEPNVVLVYGDTNSTLAGAVAAVKLHVPVAHVEAGLRSFNRRMPEEINRILTDHAADLLFTPTPTATHNLATEGIPAERVVEVGDVMFDAALDYGEAASSRLELPAGVEPHRYVLVTIHRAENTDDPERLATIVRGLAAVARELPVLLPLHPRTRVALERIGLDRDLEAAVHVVPPVGYLEMLALERNAAVIATDSGGVQKEAFFAKVPCVTLRDETEWIELVEHGWNRLVPPVDAERIRTEILAAAGVAGEPVELYGGGKASAHIVKELVRRYGATDSR